MFSRGIALCSILALAAVAQGGVQVQLVPVYCPGGTCNPGTGLCVGGTHNGLACACTVYAPNSVVQVDVKLAQTPGGADQLLRMVELDMTNTSASLGIVFPLTHDKDTPGTGDDIYFWSFDSLANCVSTHSFCGFRHFVDFNLLAGPVDTRLKMFSIAFYGLSAEGTAQILLPASGAPVTVGKLQATLPGGAGNYTLNMMNPGDALADRGARVDFGFDPHIIWRDRATNANCTGAGTPFACCTGPGTGTCPAEVTGGTLTFTVGSEQCGGGTGPSVLTWESVITHTRTGQTPIDVPLDIPDNVRCTSAGVPYTCCTGAGTGTCTGSFSEPRTGVKKLVVTFNGALNPATAIPANVTICGNNSAGSPVDLNPVAITAGIVAGSNDMKMEINFAPRLPDFARYRITLKPTILGAGGGPIQAGTGGFSRILTALQGDMTGDRRVNSTDVGGCRTQIPRDPINAAILTEVRGDVNNDKRINSTDVGFARTLVGNDARAIPDPVCP